MAGFMRGVLAAAALTLAGAASAQTLGGDYTAYRSAALDLGAPLNVSSYEAPFAHGPMAILVPGKGKLETYSLALCQEGRAVCAGRHVGTLTVQDGVTVVRGLFGRTFYLATGGHGVVERGGVQKVLTWDARANGVN